MRIYYSARTTWTGAVLILICLLMSRWQWNRYLEKEAYIETLNSRLLQAVQPLDSLLAQPTVHWPEYIHRRFTVSGRYDFSKEFLLKNRKYNDEPGFFIVTPLHLSPSGQYVLVNRGFIPYDQQSSEARAKFQRPAEVSFAGLVKASMEGWHLFELPLGPHDPKPTADTPWLDSWLRIEIPKIQAQIPYPLLPIYFEIVDGFDPVKDSHKFLESKSGKDDMLSLATREVKIAGSPEPDLQQYPIPVFDTVVPPGRHYGYVFQWIFIAFLVGATTVILQLRRPRNG